LFTNTHVELAGHGLLDERGGHARVDAAAQPAHYMVVPNLCANAIDGRLDEALHRPVGFELAHAEQEVLEHLATARRMYNLGMELGSRSAA
jgi:hypothetical protein